MENITNPERLMVEGTARAAVIVGEANRPHRTEACATQEELNREWSEYNDRVLKARNIYRVTECNHYGDELLGDLTRTAELQRRSNELKRRELERQIADLPCPECVAGIPDIHSAGAAARARRG